MREEIEKYLGTVAQSTAKTIAEKLGIDRLDVARELNAMAKTGLLERELKKGEYAYWLSRGDAPAETVPDAVREQAAAVVQAAAAPRVPVTTTDSPDQSEERRGALEHLQDRFIELLDVLGLPPTIGNAIAAAREMKGIALQTAAERDRLQIELAGLEGRFDELTLTNSRLRENNAALERRLDELTLGKPGAKAPLFITVGRYSKPMRHDSIDKAQRRAGATLRSEKESEVLVCEPIGSMVRGSVWRDR